MNKKKLILIITSCLYPNSFDTNLPIKIDSLENRVKRYIYTIKKLDTNFFDKVYFIDNSVYNVKDFKNLYEIIIKKKIILVNFTPSKFSYTKGKGFQEAEMINHILKDFDDHTKFFKITGTIPIKNISKAIKLIDKKSEENDFLCSTYISSLTRKIDTRFFLTNKKTWFSFKKYYQKFIDDKNNIYFEHALFIFSKASRINLQIFYPNIENKNFIMGDGKIYKNPKVKYLINKFLLNI